MDMKKKAYALLLITLVSGALLPILLTAAKTTNIYDFFFGVYAVSSAVSLAFLAYRKKTGELADILKDYRKIAIVCFTGIVSYLPIEFGIAYAEKFISASLATAIFRMSPLLMLLLLPPMLRERLSRYQIVALVLAFAGIYIGISGGSLLGIFQNSNIGIMVFLVFMALGYALSMILIKKYVFDIGAVIALSSVTMLVLFAVLALLYGMPFPQFNASHIISMLYIGAFFNVFSFFMYFIALRPVKATVVANIYFFSPFITFLFAAAFLGEAIQPYYIAIALLAGIGIIIQRFDRVGGRYIASSKNGDIRRMAIFDVTGIFAETGEVGIRAAIKDGGRVLAIKLGGEHAKNVAGAYSDNDSYGLYTDSHAAISEESKYVKDVLGVGDGEFVVMKAGRLDECEQFFEGLYKKIM